MEIDYIAIGQRIHKFRTERGMTQEYISELAGLTPAHFSHIENGNTKVSLPSLLQIAFSLDVTLDDLVFDNICHTKHVSLKEMDMLLADCTDAEARALITITEAGKRALRSVE
jgi:transcriptional regulator with XRE-family HTH domain